MKKLVLRRAAVLLFAGCAAVGIAVPSAAQSTITPTAKDLNKSFDADSTEWVERFEHEGRAVYDNRATILGHLGLKPGMNVADIGAGSGLFSRLIAQRVAPGGTVYAVDIAKNLVDVIARTAKEQNLPNLKAVLGDPRSPKLEPNSVDLVMIVDAYHHFEYPKEMLAEIKKALRPDGLFVFVDFNRIEGMSRDYILKMVRAGQGTFTDEIINAGFDLVERHDGITKENYLLKFRPRPSTSH